MLPLSVVPMDVAQQAQVQARVEERVRSGSDIKTAEAELAPVLRYDVLWRGGREQMSVLYNPRFMHTSAWDRRLPDPSLVNPATLNLSDPNATPLSALHGGGLGYEATHRRWRLSAYQLFAYGPIFTTALLVQAPWNGVALPPDPSPIVPATFGARLRLLFLQTQLFVPVSLGPRTAIVPGFAYNAFGGADRGSRGVIALTRGPGVSLAIEHAASRSDRLVTTVNAGWISTTFDDAREGAIIVRAEATQSWRRSLGSKLSSEILGGAALGGDRFAGYTLFTLAHAALLWDSWGQPRVAPGAQPYAVVGGRGERLQLGVAAKVQPWLDLFSGELEQRGVLALASSLTVGRATLRAGLSHARVFGTPRSVATYSIVLGEGGGSLRVTPSVTADLGFRAGEQRFDNAIRFHELTQLTVFGALGWTPLPARL